MLLPTLRRITQQTNDATGQRGDLRVHDLTVGYGDGRKVIDRISFTARAGEIVAILGKSGIGKTTLLHAISGLLPIDGGSLSLVGRLAYVMQKDLLISWRTIKRNVLLPIEIMGGDIQAAEIRTASLLHEEGLGDLADKYPLALSGGMRQKVSFIRMQVADPDIVLLDEPFSALDYVARLRHGRRLRAWAMTNRKTAIYVTHDIEEAISLGDKLLVLGGTPSSVLVEVDVDLQESQRDPVTLRKTEEFQDKFSLIWQTLKA